MSCESCDDACLEQDSRPNLYLYLFILLWFQHYLHWFYRGEKGPQSKVTSYILWNFSGDMQFSLGGFLPQKRGLICIPLYTKYPPITKWCKNIPQIGGTSPLTLIIGEPPPRFPRPYPALGNISIWWMTEDDMPKTRTNVQLLSASLIIRSWWPIIIDICCQKVFPKNYYVPYQNHLHPLP